MYYQCEHFKIWELVDKDTHAALGDSAWMLFRPEALSSLDKIREYFDKEIVINNWHGGGDLSYCGFRPYNVSVGARYSQHRLGNAFDLHFGDAMSADEVRKEILAHKDDRAFIDITCLETNISWVHVDFRNIADRIRLVKP
jgi:hypothetical protein